MTTDLSEPERLVRDALIAMYERPRGGAIAEERDQRARDLVALLRPLLVAEPEIVVGRAVCALPTGSLAIKCTAEGEPYVDFPPFRVVPHLDMGVRIVATQSFLVLYRAPAPAPQVGDVVATVDELNALPTKTAVRSQIGARNILERSVDGRWYNTAGHALNDALLASSWLPARVLDPGGDS